MKRKLYIYIAIVAVLNLFEGCKEDTLPLFEGDNYIQFSRPLNDSLTCTFLDVPDTSHRMFPISVDLIGIPSTQDRNLEIQVIPEVTTAQAKHYEVPKQLILGANKVRDTIWLKVNNTPDLKDSPVKIVYQIKETDAFKVGERNYSMGVLYFTNKISQPIWWRGTVQSSFLGTYSDKKYALFIKLTNRVDIDPNNLTELTELTLILKNHLREMKNEGNTVYENDGTEMTVNLIGG